MAKNLVYEVWRGDFVVESLSCDERGATGLIIEEAIHISSPQGSSEIVCGELIFRGKGKIVTSSNLTIRADRISGPLVLEGYVAGQGGAMADPGQAGTIGSKGESGQKGVDAKPYPGHPFAKPPTIGGDGTDGTSGLDGGDGTVGRSGRPGRRGPDITLFLNWISPDTSISAVSVGGRGSKGQVGSVGGSGGDGGDGGAGGRGPDGNFFYPPGDGGAGGNGGPGGNGGEGGNGGRGGEGGRGGDIRVIFSDNSFAEVADVPLSLASVGGAPGLGGAAGTGGAAGAGGAAGIGGPAGEYYWRVKGYPKGSAGRDGIPGSAGVEGSDGSAGKPGAMGNRGFVSWGANLGSHQDVIQRLSQPLPGATINDN